MRKMVLWVMTGLFLLLVLLGAASGTWAQDGKAIYTDKCMPCHGEKGKGNGPLASTFDPKPHDFCLPEFWQGDVDKKITNAITKGKDQMIPVDLKPEAIKAVVEYIKGSCKK
jgi:mono/diheme cytochrome c family protein